MKFYLGTTNLNKVSEIAAILQATGCDLEVTHPIDPEETEPDFMGNAQLKARVYSRHVGGMTISEDSGLIVPAISGLPGVYSARFSDCVLERDGQGWKIVGHAPSGRKREEIDASNNARVIELMKDVRQPYRAAQFSVALVVCDRDGEIRFRARTDAYGWIADTPSGDNGFGYDPIFIGKDTNGLTYAQLDTARKNLRSHRRKVLQELKHWLAEFILNDQ